MGVNYWFLSQIPLQLLLNILIFNYSCPFKGLTGSWLEFPSSLACEYTCTVRYEYRSWGSHSNFP